MVLQQKWSEWTEGDWPAPSGNHEWREVPIVVEESPSKNTPVCMLPSWDPASITKDQKLKYQVLWLTGQVAFDSGRKIFSVRCMHCQKSLHNGTTDPSYHMNLHDELGCR